MGLPEEIVGDGEFDRNGDGWDRVVKGGRRISNNNRGITFSGHDGQIVTGLVR